MEATDLPVLRLLIIGENGCGKSTFINKFCYPKSNKKKQPNQLQKDFLSFHLVNLVQKESKFAPLTKSTLEKAKASAQKKRKYLQFKEKEKALKFTVKLCEVPFLFLFYSKDELFTKLPEYQYDFFTSPHGIIILSDASNPNSLQVTIPFSFNPNY